MNDLQKLLKLRGITMQALADLTGHGMHCVQKTVKGLRKSPQVRASIADALGLQADQCFGPTASIHLRRLISREIGREVYEHKQRLEQKVLGCSSVTGGRAVVNV